MLKITSKDREIYIIAAILVVAILLRVLAITVPLNEDETAWMRRGSAFAREILDRKFDSTYERHHPGVTNMWLIGIGMVLNYYLQQYFPQWFGLATPFTDLETALRQEDYFITWYVIPRMLQAIVTSVGIVGIYWTTKQLFKRSIALVAIGLLLLEPFFTAYQRFISTDGMMSIFSTLSLLLFLLYWKSKSYRSRLRLLLLASGISMGLATAGKITALFAISGAIACLICIELGLWKRNFEPRRWQTLLDFTLWGMAIALTIFILWPQLWTNPIETVERLQVDLVKETHRGNFFFLGETVDRLNWCFYPLVFLYRFSPILQLGTVAGSMLLLVPRWRRKLDIAPQLLAMVTLSVAIAIVFFYFENKFDRYLLTIVPFLCILAAVGWMHLAERFKFPPLVYSIIAIQAAIAVAISPYFIAYYNPIFASFTQVENIFKIGQGEGLDLAAKWLNQQPASDRLNVASIDDEVFSAYFWGTTWPLKAAPDEDEGHWTQSNRVVFYANQLQRQQPNTDIIDYFRPLDPIYVVRLQGIEYAWVYTGPVPVPAEQDAIALANPIDFDRGVRLVGYDLHRPEGTCGDRLRVTLDWQFSQTPTLPWQVRLHLGSGVEENVSLLNGMLLGDRLDSETIVRDVRFLDIPRRNPGAYTFAISILEDDRSLGNPVSLGKFTVEPGCFASIQVNDEDPA